MHLRYPAGDTYLEHYSTAFQHEHLPPGLPRELAQQYRALAQLLIDSLPPGNGLYEAVGGLRRSKDEAVSTAVHMGRETSGNPLPPGGSGGTVGA